DDLVELRHLQARAFDSRDHVRLRRLLHFVGGSGILRTLQLGRGLLLNRLHGHIRIGELLDLLVFDRARGGRIRRTRRRAGSGLIGGGARRCLLVFVVRRGRRHILLRRRSRLAHIARVLVLRARRRRRRLLRERCGGGQTSRGSQRGEQLI